MSEVTIRSLQRATSRGEWNGITAHLLIIWSVRLVQLLDRGDLPYSLACLLLFKVTSMEELAW